MKILLPLALLAACTTTPTEPVDEVTEALELELGGLDTSDEAPLFGEEDLFEAAAIEADAQVADEMEGDTELATMESAPDADVLDVMMLWGQLPADPSATAARDWSGELRLSRGGMYVRRRIGFEEQTDRVRPRTSRDAIRFDSVTRPFADGLALRIVDPARSSVDPQRLRYTNASTGEVRDLDLSRLRTGAIREDVGDGNRVIVVATRRHDACQHGFIRGRWHKIAPNAATYRGVVANPRGEVVGHIRGIAGQRRNGEAVMFGKFISREGGFVGLVKGTYADGEFDARWIDRGGDHGRIHGMYFEGPNPRAGGLLARWAETSCDAR